MIYEKEKRYIIPFDDVPSDRAEMPEITVDERRRNFVEVETGFPEEVAVAEAKRCLSCRRCLGCALCWAECKPEAINFDIPDEELDLDFAEIVLTKGQDNSFHPFNSELGYGSYADVITDLQFERMLSPTGPTDGLVVSPLDGEIATRIAIVLVSLVCQAFKEKFLSDSEKIGGLKIVDGVPESVEKGQKEEPLKVTFSEDGQSKKENFDLVVVLTKPKVSPEIASLSKKLKQEIM